jgi:hypothetical protein
MQETLIAVFDTLGSLCKTSDVLRRLLGGAVLGLTLDDIIKGEFVSATAPQLSPVLDQDGCYMSLHGLKRRCNLGV